MPNEICCMALSDRGLVRANNEDAYLVRPEDCLCAVCDGLGGHAAGEVASNLAVEALRDRIHGSPQDAAKVLLDAIEEANRKILRDQQLHPERMGMGTTLSSIWMPWSDQNVAWIAHIGDSRIYRFRAGTLTQLTEDHSPVFRLFKEGSISKDQLRMHPQKNLIERSLGLATYVNCDIFKIAIEPGDIFLLCTDGLSDCLSDNEIAGFLSRGEWDQLPAMLVEGALEAGGYDNVTVVLARAQ